jgi:hypothetical protein
MLTEVNRFLVNNKVFKTKMILTSVSIFIF